MSLLILNRRHDRLCRVSITNQKYPWLIDWLIDWSRLAHFLFSKSKGARTTNQSEIWHLSKQWPCQKRWRRSSPVFNVSQNDRTSALLSHLMMSRNEMEIWSRWITQRWVIIKYLRPPLARLGGKGCATEQQFTRRLAHIPRETRKGKTAFAFFLFRKLESSFAHRFNECFCTSFLWIESMNAKIALGSESNNLIEKARLYVRISEETFDPQTLLVQKHCYAQTKKKTMMIFRTGSAVWISW